MPRNACACKDLGQHSPAAVTRWAGGQSTQDLRVTRPSDANRRPSYPTSFDPPKNSVAIAAMARRGPCPNAWRCSCRARSAWPNRKGAVVRPANQRFACAADTPHHGIFQMPPPASLSNRRSFPPRASPGFCGTTSPSATLPARPAPREVPVSACHATDWTSGVAPVSLFHACCRHHPGGTDRCMRRSLPGRWRPPPSEWRVSFRACSFGACSAFTRVAAPHGR